MQRLKVNTMRHMRRLHLQSNVTKSNEVPKKKPSSELIQTLPDLYEPYSAMREAKAIGQRRQYNHGHSNGFHRLPTCRFYRRTSDGFTFGVRSFTTQSVPMTDMNQVQVQHSIGLTHGYSELLERLQINNDAVEFLPHNISERDMKHLLSLQSKSAIKRELKFLARKEHRKLKNKDRKIKEKAMKIQSPVHECNEEVVPSTIISKYGQSSRMTLLKQSNMARSILFGLPLVIDLSYDSLMSRREIQSLMRQMDHGLHENLNSTDPFNVHWTNITPEGPSHSELLHRYGDRYHSDLLVTTTEKSPVEVFPAHQLVYLSPDSPYTMDVFDNEAIYVIGGFVDRTIKVKSSLTKADAAGVKHAKLPLDDYLVWKGGCANRNLTIDQVMAILTELKGSNDWEKALQYVPSRKQEINIT